MQTWLAPALQPEQGECVVRIVDAEEGRSLNVLTIAAKTMRPIFYLFPMNYLILI